MVLLESATLHLKTPSSLPHDKVKSVIRGSLVLGNSPIKFGISTSLRLQRLSEGTFYTSVDTHRSLWD